MEALRFKEVYDYILDNKLYRDPSVSVARLADQLSISQEHLRKLFIDYCGQDFRCFINELRVYEAKRMIEENYFSGFSIDAIGRMAGFNTKSEFFSNFKQRTGRLPSDYKATCRYVY